MSNSADQDNHESKTSEIQQNAWRDLKLGEEILIGDRFCDQNHEWITVTEAHLEYTDKVEPASYPLQRRVAVLNL